MVPTTGTMASRLIVNHGIGIYEFPDDFIKMEYSSIQGWTDQMDVITIPFDDI